MSALWIIAIAVCLLFIWLLMQPKQGTKASNASRARKSVPPPPKQQGISPQPADQSPLKAHLPPSPPPVDRVPQSKAELSVPSPSLEAEVRQLLNSGQKIAAVKRVRDATHWGLKESKDYVESLERHERPPMTVPHVTSEPTPALRQDVRRLLAARQKVTAVKLVRDQTHWSLRESKQYVDDLQAEEF